MLKKSPDGGEFCLFVCLWRARRGCSLPAPAAAVFFFFQHVWHVFVCGRVGGGVYFLPFFWVLVRRTYVFLGAGLFFWVGAGDENTYIHPLWLFVFCAGTLRWLRSRFWCAIFPVWKERGGRRRRALGAGPRRVNYDLSVLVSGQLRRRCLHDRLQIRQAVLVAFRSNGASLRLLLCGVVLCCVVWCGTKRRVCQKNSWVLVVADALLLYFLCTVRQESRHVSRGGTQVLLCRGGGTPQPGKEGKQRCPLYMHNTYFVSLVKQTVVQQ